MRRFIFDHNKNLKSTKKTLLLAGAGFLLILIFFIFKYWAILIALAIATMLKYILGKKDISIPYIHNYLKREYFKTKFSIVILENKAGANTKKTIPNKCKLLTKKIKQKILCYIILLTQNSQDSFSVLREDIQNKNINKLDITINKKTVPLAELRQKVKNGKIKNTEQIIEQLINKLFQIHKQKQKKTAAFSLAGMAAIIITTVIASLITTIMMPLVNFSKAASYTWTQTSWTTQSADTAAHDSDQSGWVKYISKDTDISAGADITLTATTTLYATDDGTLTTSAGASGGGFDNGATTTATINGTAPDQNISLLHIDPIADNDFVCKIRAEGNGGDYTTLALWEDAVESDLTAATSKVFTVSDTGTYVSADDAETVTFTGGGTGTLIHINTDNKAYIISVSGTVNTGTVTINGGHTFTISDTGTQIGRAIAECYNDWPSGASKATINGFTTDADNYVRIYTPASERHTGKAKNIDGSYTGFAIKLDATWTGCLSTGDSYTQVDGIIFDLNGLANSRGLLAGAGAGVGPFSTISNCIAFNGNSASSYGFFFNNSSTLYVHNCIAYDVFRGFHVGGSAKNYLYNCTAADTDEAAFYLDVATYDQTVKNCLASSTTGFVKANSAKTLSLDYSASADGTADDFGGTGNHGSTTFTFVDYTNNDFRLDSSDSGAKDLGTDLSDDGILPFSQDIEAQIRTGTWDIGADEYSTETSSRSGTFESATIDLSANFGDLSEYLTLSCSSSTPASTTIAIQVAANNDNATWNYADLESGNQIPSSLDELRYFRYKATLSTTDKQRTPIINSVTVNYSIPQILESSKYNSGSASNLLNKIEWSETQQSGTDIKFQMRTSPDNSSWTSWLGPTGTSDFYTDPAGGESINSTLSDSSDDQWIQYRAILTAEEAATYPTLSDITITYIVNAAPQIQNITASQQSDGTVSISYEVRDTDSTSGSTTPGYITPSFQYWNGSAWASCTTMAAGDTDNKAVDESDYTEYTATWTAATDFADQFMNNTAEIKVIVNDNEAANNTASSTSSTFILDTTAPASTSVSVVATSSPARLILSATDDSAIQMKISLASNLAGASWESYSSSDTIALAGNPDTVYAQFKDAYSNTTSIINATTPITPTNLIIRDTTNTATSEYQLFVAWTVINPEPSAGFKRYTVYRSTDASSYSSLANITSTSTNYYLDQSLDNSTTYYYKITSEDDDDSISPYSSVVSDIPNGQGGTDTTDPTISSVATSSISTTMATITWDTDEVSSSTVEYITSTGGDFSSASSETVHTMRDTSSGLGQHQIILTGLSPSTDYYFRVKSGDPAWNVATDIFGTDGYMFTTLDGAAISNVSASEATNNEAVITWITDVSSDSYIVYSSNSDLSGSTETGTTTLSTAHSISLTDLTQGTIYYYYVKSTDGSSNLATDNNAGNYYTFTTTQDTTAPVITFNSSTGISNITSSSTIISWTTDEAATSTVFYGATQNSYTYSETINNYNYNHSISLSSLSTSTTHYFKIVSTDANGNSSTDNNSGSDYSFTTLDSDGPIISSVTTADTTITTAQISWTTDEAASSFVQYSTATTSFASSYIEAGKNDSATSHSVDLSGLIQYQTYYYRVRSVDSTGNQTTDDNSSAYYSFTTLNGPIISSVSATPSETSSVVVWTTDSLSDSFVVFDTSSDFASSSEQGISAKTYTSHSVNLSGLSANTLYYYKVRSTAVNNGATTDDDNYSFTTTQDSQAPVISSVSESLIEDTQAVITWSTDEASDSMIEYGSSSGSYPSSVSNNSLNFSHSLLLSSLNTNTSYYYHVISTDDNSNAATSTEYSFTTLETLSEESAVATRETTARNLGRTESGGGGIITKEVIVEKKDTTIPVISGINVSNITYDSASISWTTNENSNSFVEYGPSLSYGETYGIYNSTKQHLVKLNHLTPETNYYYRILSSDSSGNLSKSANQTFTTDAQDEEEIIEMAEEKLFQDIEDLSKKDFSDEKVFLSAANAATKIMDIIGEASDQVSIETLEPPLTEQYEYFQEISQVIPAPILAGAPSVLTTANTAMIAWSTDKESNSLVALSPEEMYGIDPLNPYIQVIGNPEEKTTSHAITIYDLEPETLYHYQVRSKANLGDTSASEDYTFTTENEILEITNHAIQVISNEKAIFKWITNLETDTAIKYIPYRDNVLMVEEAKILSNDAISIIHEMTIEDFEAGVVYDIELSGKDINEKLITKQLQAFSTSKDDLPPIIYQVQTESAISPGKKAKIQTIISWLTNEPATSRIYYDEGLSVKDKFSSKTALDKNFSKKHTAVLTHFKPGTVYRFKIESIDSGGNEALSKTFTILTPRQTETVFQVILKNFEKTFSWINNFSNLLNP